MTPIFHTPNLAKLQPFQIRIMMNSGELDVTRISIAQIHNLVQTGFEDIQFFSRLTSKQFEKLEFGLLNKQQFLSILPKSDSSEARKKIARIPSEIVNLYLRDLPDFVFEHLTNSQIRSLEITSLSLRQIDILFPLNNKKLSNKRFELLSLKKIERLIKKLKS